MEHSTLFAIMFVASILTFVASCAARLRLVALGGKTDRLDHPLKRVGDMLLYAFFQKRVVSYPFGINHFFLFWSFLVLMLANLDFIFAGIFPGAGEALHRMSWYAPFAFVFDLVSLAVLVLIGIAVIRRLFFAPAYIDEPLSRDAFIILSMIAALMIAFFGSHAADIALGDAVVRRAMPVSDFISSFMPASAATCQIIGNAFWWIHAVVLMVFLNYLPYSKHMHILTAIPNCFLLSLAPVNTLPREEFRAGGTFGIGQVNRFTWKDLFDSFSCTECGRCQDQCPASCTGKPLSPRVVVHDIKMNLLRNGPALEKGGAPVQPLIGTAGEGSVKEEALWACTSCGACMDACPVFIEQMPKILQMRRHLVEMEAKFPEELLGLFDNMEQRSNPWGIAPAERTKWAADINAKPFSPDTEYLFFVGCAGAFDPRSKQVTLALARILDAAGVSWGILGRDESCCGDSLRRLGNEYVFARMAQENLKRFAERGVKKVITQCPHCFSTLKNDYSQFGGTLEVIHHTELIDRLIREGRLKTGVTSSFGRVVFHDSCYLGRHNNVYEAPRAVVAAATGKAAAEMKRAHNRSFCCGAGGGRMWMEESVGKRINVERVREAVATGSDTICVSCPYCMTMFEDGLKEENNSRVRVCDVAELVAEGLPPRPPAAKGA